MQPDLFVGETVLYFALEIIGEAITDGGVHAPDIVTPLHVIAIVNHCSEKLLVPANSGEKLRSE